MCTQPPESILDSLFKLSTQRDAFDSQLVVVLVGMGVGIKGCWRGRAEDGRRLKDEKR